MHADPKRKLWLLGLSIPVIATGALIGFAKGPKVLQSLFASTGLITLHGLIPFFDRYFAEDSQPLPPQQLKQLQHDPYYTRVVAAYIPLQYVANLYTAHLATRKDTALLDTVLLASLLSVVNVVGMNVAHELGHKSKTYKHLLAHIALLPSAYSHFRIEHNYGHHRFVATPLDSASAYYGESFWRFLPRTVMGGFKSAINIEKNRLARRHLSFWSLNNELLQVWTAGLIYHGCMLKLFGKKWLLFQAVQVAYTITLLEAVNYMEHYGLKRQRLANGDYAPVTAQHSWNHNSLFSNLLFYQLQRHRDHHAHPTKPFQLLESDPTAPLLPKGYGALFGDVFRPKRWFRLMHPRLLQHYHHDLSQIHQRSDHAQAS
ncbi:alkane 1-monooxygenase [Acinetobacter sp. B51(2017)]|uniref:alkane 1-monooxygenase n=1 Tax=Acinetobacter sp. B51(2017) TaxID=2060938 RepID=UPI000F079AB4|nr:alkane 1-monooxygenase [Acinetobacter sp. B51(2017)]